jgi:hypothetical protein
MLRQPRSFDHFKDEDVRALGLLKIVDSSDVGMVEGGHQTGLTLESRGAFMEVR